MSTHLRTDLDTTHRWLARGVWGLPIYGVLLAVSTLTHQPSYSTDFPGYASYVTTDLFLASHLGASILGAVFGVVGIGCAAVLLAERGPRPGRTLLAGVLGVAGNVLATAVFGVAAFAQPAIGRAFQGGTRAIVGVNDDVYGPELVATVITGLVLMMAGAVLLGLAMVRADARLRWAGIGYAVSMPVFVIAGFSVQIVQPVAGLGVAAATAVLAARMSRVAVPSAGAPVVPLATA